MQHRLKEHESEVFALLERGAAVYVCGDAARMAKDVKHVLVDIMAKGRRILHNEAELLIKEMRAEGRYQV